MEEKSPSLLTHKTLHDLHSSAMSLLPTQCLSGLYLKKSICRAFIEAEGKHIEGALEFIGSKPHIFISLEAIW